MVLDAATGGEVVGTDDAVVGEDNAACCHAQVCCMIGHWAAYAAYQTTFAQKQENNRTVRARTSQKVKVLSEGICAPLFTFRDGRAVGIGDEAGETDVDGAAEASVHRCSWGVVGDTLAVVKLPTHWDHTAPHIFTALFTYKAGVDAWRKNKHYVSHLVIININL